MINGWSSMGFGVPVLTARDGKEVCEALNRAFSADGPVVVEVSIDGTEYAELITNRRK
jgi:thiamine pyrophosphate-dependent acetolactate synthase large subunit-like protein